MRNDKKDIFNYIKKKGRSEIIVLCYLMRMDTSQTGAQKKQRHLTPRLHVFSTDLEPPEPSAGRLRLQ